MRTQLDKPRVYAYEPRPDAFTQTMNCGSCQLGIGTPNVRPSHARPLYCFIVYAQWNYILVSAAFERTFFLLPPVCDFFVGAAVARPCCLSRAIQLQ
jgi:hypothetical protein